MEVLGYAAGLLFALGFFLGLAARFIQALLNVISPPG